MRKKKEIIKITDAPALEEEVTEQIIYIPEIETSSAIHVGNRSYQQDRVYVSKGAKLRANETLRFFATVCDGMGGMTDGGKASEIAVSLLKKRFEEIKTLRSVDIPAFFDSVMKEADEAISQVPKENGRGSGTTMVSVIVEDNRFWWASAGDSRIYYLHSGQMKQLTRDHNYDMVLKQRIENGEMSHDEYEMQKQKEALVSFLGIGNLRIKDISDMPVLLQEGDIIMLCSDGICKTLDDDEIARTLLDQSVKDKAKTLVEKAVTKNTSTQDNTSVAIINYKSTPIVG